MSRRRAFSLSELLMGLALLALVLVTALGVLFWALAGSQRQQTQTRAAFLAQQQMEKLWLQPRLEEGRGVFAPPFQDYAWQARVSEAPPMVRVSLQVTGPRGARYLLAGERRAQLRWLTYRDRQDLMRVEEGRPDPELLFSGLRRSDYSISPDGQSLAYVEMHQGKPQIYLKSLSDGNPAQAGKLLFEHPHGANEPCFSPDGSRLAFTALENGHSQTFVYSLSQDYYRNRSKNEFDETSPAWHPNSQDLIVCRSGSSLWLRKADGSQEKLVESTGWNAAPNMSSDGKTLMFMSSRDGNPEIYSLSLPKKTLRRLTNNPAYDTFPRVSEDGKRILYQSERDGTPHLFTMNLDGSGTIPVCSESGEFPQWGD